MASASAAAQAGRSTLSDAFSTQDETIIYTCLSHPSASEEKLLQAESKHASAQKDAGSSDGPDAESTAEFVDREAHSVTHEFSFLQPDGGRSMLIRELPITRADNPFGSDVAPEDDTTGLALWPASVLLGMWVTQVPELLEGKTVIELGAGCGLPGLAAAVFCNPRKVYLTDIHVPTIRNMEHNARLNDLYLESGLNGSDADALNTQAPVVAVGSINWKDTTTFPSKKVDVIIGSDLVYDENILQLLVFAVNNLLASDGIMLYVAPDNARAGMDSMVSVFESNHIQCVSVQPCPPEYFENPLKSKDMDQFVLHFYDLALKVPHSLYIFKKNA